MTPEQMHARRDAITLELGKARIDLAETRAKGSRILRQLHSLWAEDNKLSDDLQALGIPVKERSKVT